MSRGRHRGWLSDLLTWRPENWIQAPPWPLFWNFHSTGHLPLVGLGFYFSEKESWSGVVGFLIIVLRAILWVWLELWMSPGLESEDLAHVRALPVTLGRAQYSWTRVFICISGDNYPFMQEINTLGKRWKEWNLVCASGNSQPRKRSRHKQIFTKELDQCQDAEKCRRREVGQRKEGPASAGAESRDGMRTVRKSVGGQALPQKSQTQPSLPSPNPCCPYVTLTSPSCHLNSNPLPYLQMRPWGILQKARLQFSPYY